MFCKAKDIYRAKLAKDAKKTLKGHKSLKGFGIPLRENKVFHRLAFRDLWARIPNALSNLKEGTMNGQSPTMERDRKIQRLLKEENFPLAFIAGLLAAAAGAGIWAGITVLTGYQIGFMAIGVGALVALSIRAAGKGLSRKFQVLGALLSLLGCAVGNFLTVCYYIAQNESMGFIEVLTLINPASIPDLMISTFSAMDALFYGIAVYEGYRLSLRQLPEAEFNALQYS